MPTLYLNKNNASLILLQENIKLNKSNIYSQITTK